MSEDAAVAGAKTVADWQREVHALAREKGWHPADEDPWGSRLWKMLGNLLAEVAEAWEEARKPDFDARRIYCACGIAWDATKIDGLHTDLKCSVRPGPIKPEGFPIELADLVIRALDVGAALGLEPLTESAVKVAVKDFWPVPEGDVFRRLCGLYRLAARTLLEAEWRTSAASLEDGQHHHVMMRVALAAIVGHAERFAVDEGFDLWSAVDIKHRFNNTRPARHGGKRA